MNAGSRRRLRPLSLDEWSEDARAALPRYLRRPQLYLSSAPDALPMPNVLGLFAHHVRLGEAWLAAGNVLAEDPQLDPRHRELLVLRVAWRTRSSYEWAEHVRIGTDAGVTADQIEAIPHGTDADVWTPVERDLLAAADEMLDRFHVTDDTWGRLTDRFDDAQLLELLFVVGCYMGLAAVFNTVGLEPGSQPNGAPRLPEIGA